MAASAASDLESFTTSHERNPGVELDLGWVSEVRVNRPAVIRRATSHTQRRTVKKAAQLGWLLRLVSLIDLTTLAGDDTPGKVRRLCAKARNPVRLDLAEKLEVDGGDSDGAAQGGDEQKRKDGGAAAAKGRKLLVGAVCVYPSRVPDAVKALKGTGIPVASVAAGFPAGQTPLRFRIAEIEEAVGNGAKEIDIVISREHVINGNWKALYDEIKAFRKACGEAHLKTILATGELPTFRDVYKASLVAMMGGADFIKTSTGKEKINATLPVGIVMIRAVRDYYERTGFKVGFKPAGGISSAKVACQWLALMYEELGEEWTKPDLFRIGASSLLIDVERQLEHGLTGKYAGKNYMGQG